MTNRSHLDFLVVAPNDDQLHFIEKTLHENGYTNVLGVSSVTAAREILITKKVLFVITEFGMPSMNGIELTKFIRRVPAMFETPVLVLFDQDQQAHTSHAMDELADNYLLAPFSANAIMEAIRRIWAEKEAPSPDRQKLTAAKKFLLSQQYDNAISLAKEILAKGDNDEAFYILGEAYYWQQDYDTAAKYLRWLIKSRPDSKTMHLFSKVCRAENQCGDAVAYLLEATVKNPLNLDLKIDLGKLYLDLGIDERAADIFQEVFRSTPSDLQLIKIGKAYLKKGQIDKAAEFLDRTIRPIPETVYIFHQYAMALAKEKRYPESAEQLKKCLRLTPDNKSFLMELGEMLVKMGDKGRAEKVYKRLLQLDPGQKKAQKILNFLQRRETVQTNS
jgi:predicted Zn-dependent protease